MGGISVMLLMGMLSAMYVFFSSNCRADYLFCSKLCF